MKRSLSLSENLWELRNTSIYGDVMLEITRTSWFMVRNDCEQYLYKKRSPRKEAFFVTIYSSEFFPAHNDLSVQPVVHPDTP